MQDWHKKLTQISSIVLSGGYLSGGWWKRTECFRRKLVGELWLTFPWPMLSSPQAGERGFKKSIYRIFNSSMGIRDICDDWFISEYVAGAVCLAVMTYIQNCMEAISPFFNVRTKKIACAFRGVCGSLMMVVEGSWPGLSLGSPHGCDSIVESIQGIF